MAHDTFQIGDLTAVIGDNEAYDEHRAGYNGIHRLVHRTEQATLFVPSVAGFNLEHIFDGDQELRDVGGDRRVFFEPRRAPMTFKRLSESEAELHQPPTPTFHLESWTRFRLAAPHYIDVSFRCKPTQHVFRHGYIGLFWASYINAPEDKSMYLRRDQRWLQLCTPQHNHFSTVAHRDNRFDLTFTPGLGDALYKNLSPLRFDEPFFYGLFRQHMLIVMFDRSEGIRFTHSPSGGGTHAGLQTTNPAWDFQFIIPAYEVPKEYGFQARIVYRERCPRAEVLREFRDWIDSLKAPGD
jgi:hypothetical protein